MGEEFVCDKEIVCDKCGGKTWKNVTFTCHKCGHTNMYGYHITKQVGARVKFGGKN